LKIESIKVFDAYGKLVYQSLPQNNKVIINMDGLAKGIYFVQIKDEKKNALNRKLIVQ